MSEFLYTSQNSLSVYLFRSIARDGELVFIADMLYYIGIKSEWGKGGVDGVKRLSFGKYLGEKLINVVAVAVVLERIGYVRAPYDAVFVRFEEIAPCIG